MPGLMGWIIFFVMLFSIGFVVGKVSRPVRKFGSTDEWYAETKQRHHEFRVKP